MDEFERLKLIEVLKGLLEGLTPIEKMELLADLSNEMDEPFGVQILHACTVRLLMRLQRLGMSPIEFHQRLWERDRLTINAHLGPAQEPIPEPYRTIQPHQGNTPVWNDWLAETAPEGSA